MTNRRQLKSNRFLPEYVTRFKDQHGKERLRFRRKGYPSGYFKSALGTEDFRTEYHRFNNPEAIAEAAHEAHLARIIPGSAADLQRQYYAVPERLGPTVTTQTKIRSVLDRGFFDGRDDRMLADIRFNHIDAIISRVKEKRQIPNSNRFEGGVEAARKLRKELVRLFDFAEKIGLVDRSPMKHVERVKVAAGERSKGFHSWTEEEIAQYRMQHAVGTSARLAMELILWTDQRGVDSIYLGRQHIKAGRIVLSQSKTGATLTLAIAPQLLEAIMAAPSRAGAMCFLLNEWGRPFTRKGFGNKMRDWCDQAGLFHCTAHGLRKATLRRMADLEMTNKSMKSVSGHRKDDEIARYTEAANQERLARVAIGRLSEWESKRPDEIRDVMAAAAIERFAAWEMSNLVPGGDTAPQQEAVNER